LARKLVFSQYERFILLQWLQNNRDWIFSGIGVAGVAVICRLLFQRKSAHEKLAELHLQLHQRAEQETLTIVAKKFSPAHDLKAWFGGFDVQTMRPTTTEAMLGVEPASLKVLCHNLTATPITVVGIKLINTENGEIVIRKDNMAQRINAHDSSDINISFKSVVPPCYSPPLWRAQIVVNTTRNNIIKSGRFNFRDLVDNA
jgi:hypothetical protein